MSTIKYEGITKIFRTGRLEWELQMAQLSATSCSCIAIVWVSLVSFAAITLCVVSQRVIPKVSAYFIIDSVPKRLDTPSYAGGIRQGSHYELWRDTLDNMLREGERLSPKSSITNFPATNLQRWILQVYFKMHKFSIFMVTRSNAVQSCSLFLLVSEKLCGLPTCEIRPKSIIILI
jgi:hypothetical protein